MGSQPVREPKSCFFVEEYKRQELKSNKKSNAPAGATCRELVGQASRPWLYSLVILVVRRCLLSHLNMSVKRSASGHNPEPGAPHFSQGGRVGEKRERRSARATTMIGRTRQGVAFTLACSLNSRRVSS